MATYDGSLQMFIHPPKEVDMRRLVFMRWLAEHGKLEHDMAGPSSGPFVAAAASAESLPTGNVTAAA